MSERITTEEFEKRLVTLCRFSGLSGFPRKRRDRHILLKSVTLTLDRTNEYTENEINELLLCWLKEVGSFLVLNHIELRRLLIDNEYLGRGKDGSRYWVAVSSRRQMEFDAEIENVDVRAVMNNGIETRLEKKRQYLSRKKP